MGFSDIKRLAISCLKSDQYFPEDRENEPRKNYLAIGLITKEDLMEVLKNCRGDRRSYEESSDHSNRSIPMHIFKTKIWYIKLYFMDDARIFKSVHPHNEDKQP